jgi:hypothetical protein
MPKGKRGGFSFSDPHPKPAFAPRTLYPIARPTPTLRRPQETRSRPQPTLRTPTPRSR